MQLNRMRKLKLKFIKPTASPGSTPGNCLLVSFPQSSAQEALRCTGGLLADTKAVTYSTVRFGPLTHSVLGSGQRV